MESLKYCAPCLMPHSPTNQKVNDGLGKGLRIIEYELVILHAKSMVRSGQKGSVVDGWWWSEVVKVVDSAS